MENTAIEILLVEDNLTDAEMTIRALRKNHIANHLIHMEDGADALDFIFGTGSFAGRTIVNPKLILLDLKMPRVDGMGVLKRVKSDERTSMIPVVILTSSAEDPDIQKCYKLGANSYIVKPVGFDNFVMAVSGLGLYWMLLNQAPK
ncbi:MAG: response regulator [Chryseolinea sp.]